MDFRPRQPFSDSRTDLAPLFTRLSTRSQVSCHAGIQACRACGQRLSATSSIATLVLTVVWRSFFRIGRTAATRAHLSTRQTGSAEPTFLCSRTRASVYSCVVFELRLASVKSFRSLATSSSASPSIRSYDREHELNIMLLLVCTIADMTDKYAHQKKYLQVRYATDEAYCGNRQRQMREYRAARYAGDALFKKRERLAQQQRYAAGAALSSVRYLFEPPPVRSAGSPAASTRACCTSAGIFSGKLMGPRTRRLLRAMGCAGLWAPRVAWMHRNTMAAPAACSQAFDAAEIARQARHLRVASRKKTTCNAYRSGVKSYKGELEKHSCARSHTNAVRA